MKRFFFALFLVLFFQNSNAASLERFQSYLRTTQAARGEFAQKVYDKSGKLVQDSNGSFAFLRPGRRNEKLPLDSCTSLPDLSKTFCVKSAFAACVVRR